MSRSLPPDCASADNTEIVRNWHQDRDRFAREPAYLYLLEEEFALRGCALKSLNDRGDESPESQLADRIMDQIARFECLKTVERTRRRCSAREGKIVASRRANYGFELNDERTNYVVNEERMTVVRRVVRMAVHGIKRVLDADRDRGPYWHCGTIETFITDLQAALLGEGPSLGPLRPGSCSGRTFCSPISFVRP